MIIRSLPKPRTVENGGQTIVLTHEVIFPPEEDGGAIRRFEAWVDASGNYRPFGQAQEIKLDTPEKRDAINQAVLALYDQEKDK